MFFRQITPLIHKARSKILEEDDFPKLPAFLRLKPQTEALSEIEKSNIYNFLKFVLNEVKKQSSTAYFFILTSALLQLFFPVLLFHWGKLISTYPFKYSVVLILFSALIPIIQLLSGVLTQYYFLNALYAHQLVTQKLGHIIFKKLLRTQNETRAKYETGELVNLMASDTDTLSDFPMWVGDFLWLVLLLTCSFYLLFDEMGKSALIPIIIYIGIIPLTQKISKQMNTSVKNALEYRDKRMSLLSQALTAIRIIKTLNWQKKLQSEIQTIRDNEIRQRAHWIQTLTLSTLLFFITNGVAILATLAFFYITNRTWDLSIALKLIALFHIIEDPIAHIPDLLSRGSQILASSTRVVEFLKLPELTGNKAPPNTLNQSLIVENLSVQYPNSKNMALTQLNFSLIPGESLAIVGEVGSGKSTLLWALAGEIQLSSGSITKNEVWNNVAMISQEPFLISGSIRENILFGISENISENDINEALHLSCLDIDIQGMTEGIHTEIGERGISLSGGQKQRLTLARTLLSQPKIILMDDPFSAVDPEVEQKLIHNIVFGKLKNRTRIISTHRLQSLEKFDKILFLAQGKTIAFGSYSEIFSKSSAFRNLVLLRKNTEQEIKKIENKTEAISGNSLHKKSEEGQFFLLKENREKGAIKPETYKQYINLIGNKKFVFLLFLSLLVSSIPFFQRKILASGNDIINILISYTALIFIGGTITYITNKIWWLNGLNAGTNIHNQMIQSLIESKVQFIDRTPIGRILQRFSRDLEALDLRIHLGLSSMIACLLQILITLSLIIWINISLIIFIIPLLWVFFRMQRDYRNPAREAKRLDSLARSPRYIHFKEMIDGIRVIRASQKETWAYRGFLKRLKHSQRMFYGHYMINRWFSSRIPLVGAAISAISIGGVVVALGHSWITTSMASVVALYASSLWKELNWTIRTFADIESQMTSVERTIEYSHLPQEEELPSHTYKKMIQDNLSLSISNLWIRYNENLPWILKNFDLQVKKGERIGIIGRTGSGKSTLFQVLLGFIDSYQGEIFICGENIKNMTLTARRKLLAWVPQDPQIFLGTLKQNLDRENLFKDSDLILSLQLCSLGQWLKSLPYGLETKLNENGGNLSQGQKQLICLARALLRKPKIILIDEATASVDITTDQQIQRVLQDHFQNNLETSVITIAHRLETLSGYDRVIELRKA